MEVTVNGRLAVIAANTSFTYVAANPLFSGAEEYTLTITFPLKDCPANIAIFGRIHRDDVIFTGAVLPCSIHSQSDNTAPFHREGVIKIVEINDVELKGQFLAGRSAENSTRTLSTIYINELNLGSYGNSLVTPEQAWCVNSNTIEQEAVALPWVNDYSGNIQNCAKCYETSTDDDGNAEYAGQWDTDTRKLSYQPFLIYLTHRILSEAGYTPDLSAWLASPQRYILCCNTLPAAWNMPFYASALPHWSVEEYLQQIELLLGGEFAIDHIAHTAAFAFSDTVLQGIPPVTLGHIVSQHTTTIAANAEKPQYRPLQGLAYKECSHRMWPYYSCQWFVDGYAGAVQEVETLAELLRVTYQLNNYLNLDDKPNVNKLFHVREVDQYFALRVTDRTLRVQNRGTKPNVYQNNTRLQPVNEFAPILGTDGSSDNATELSIVPAWIDDTDINFGPAVFLSFSAYDENDQNNPAQERDQAVLQARKEELDSTTIQPIPAQIIEKGNEGGTKEYYDRIYVAYYDGTKPADLWPPCPTVSQFNFQHCPLILDQYELDWSVTTSPYSLSLRRTRAATALPQANIRPEIKSTFQFISDTIPNPRAIFQINGQRYICKQITATFTPTGMSHLLKGEFYPIGNQTSTHPQPTITARTITAPTPPANADAS